jgi:hypothetical protein
MCSKHATLITSTVLTRAAAHHTTVLNTRDIMPENYNVQSRADLISVNFHIIHQQHPTHGHYNGPHRHVHTCKYFSFTECPTSLELQEMLEFWHMLNTLTIHINVNERSWSELAQTLRDLSRVSTERGCRAREHGIDFARQSNEHCLARQPPTIDTQPYVWYLPCFPYLSNALQREQPYFSVQYLHHTSHNRCFKITAKFRDCDLEFFPSPFCTYFIRFRPNAHKTNVET